ncbi:adenylate kinase [Anaerohalosphaera lusitana]|uniref:Adenylate kinase n=1 Tax=Anaerohalosphaera lusitana TaxID=1936003 RepID=A0A1U9NIK5_9BACT|nr:AAA family ATPase [Anaerohalosphaera lusitana]AQT67751.1 adenylate kinase [Anaerohalosphaera lusitana]
MIAVVTGMVGIDKKQYLEEVVRLANERGKQVTLCNVGDMMYAEAPDIAAGRILDIPLQRLRSLRRSIIKDIIAKARNGENIIINTHATFRWRHGLFRAFDFDQMRQLDADYYICMVDSVDALHVRLLAEHPINHTLKDLLVWREEETIATELMKEGVNEDAGYYILARGEDKTTIESCYRMIFEPERKKAYLSFPMTHVMDMPEVLEEIADFRGKMKESFTCFDPGDLEEAYLPYRAKRAAQSGQDFIELHALGRKVRLDLAEAINVEKDISSQTYTRDFALIDQSNMIISYIPHLGEGRAAISSGVERELQHAHEAGKEVYVIWPSPKDPSVFVTQTATKVFRSLDEAAGFFTD